MRQDIFEKISKLGCGSIALSILMLLIYLYGESLGINFLAAGFSLGLIGILLTVIAVKHPPQLESRQKTLNMEFFTEKPLITIKVKSFSLYPIKEISNIDFSRNPYAGDSDMLVVAPPNFDESAIDKALKDKKNNDNPVYIKIHNHVAGMIIGLGGNYITFQQETLDQNMTLRVMIGSYSPSLVEENPATPHTPKENHADTNNDPMERL